MQSALRVLEAPSARLVEAVSLTLVELSRRGKLAVVHEFEFSGHVARRLGYLAQRLADHLDDSGLREFAGLMNEHLGSRLDVLLLTDAATQTYTRQLVERGDDVNRHWGVYGDLEYRFLSA